MAGTYSCSSQLHGRPFTIDSVTQLFAFLLPSPPLSASDGWNLYPAREEFGRLGVGTRSRVWRFTDVNKDYLRCTFAPSCATSDVYL